MISFFDTRFLKFGVVGAVGMSIDFSITWFCKEKLHLNKYIANSLGFACSVLNNFLLNRYWTFEDSTHPLNRQFVRFILVSLAGLLINNILLLTMVNYLKKNFYFLKLVVIGLVFFWNYFANLLFTFN